MLMKHDVLAPCVGLLNHVNFVFARPPQALGSLGEHIQKDSPPDSTSSTWRTITLKLIIYLFAEIVQKIIMSVSPVQNVSQIQIVNIKLYSGLYS